MFKKIIFILLICFAVTIFLSVEQFVFAGDLGDAIQGQTGKIAESYGADEKGAPPKDKSLKSLFQVGIGVVLSFLGIIFFVQTIYAGFLWMTAGGNEEQITNAKKKFINGTIGVGIVLAAYIITYFVMAKLGGATGVILGF